MRKTFTLSIISQLILSTCVFGQTLLEPNPVINNSFSYSQFEVVGYSDITNSSDNFVSYTWTRTIIEMTEGWSCAICDINLCYLDFVSSQSFGLSAGGEGNLDVHVYPNSIVGSAIVELHVVDNSDESNSVTGLYYFDQALSAPERLTENVKTYPNPVVDMLSIESGHEVHRIEIFNIEGKRMLSEQVNANGTVNLSGLASGTFILRMYDFSGQQISGNLLVKQ